MLGSCCNIACKKDIKLPDRTSAFCFDGNSFLPDVATENNVFGEY